MQQQKTINITRKEFEMPWGVSWDELHDFLQKQKSCYCCEHFWSDQQLYDDDEEPWDSGKCELDDEYVTIEKTCNHFKRLDLYKDLRI